MMDMTASNAIDSATAAYDLSSVRQLRSRLSNGDGKNLSAAAKQFEAIFVSMMLKSMRQAQDVLADESSPFNSEHVKFYRDMYDQQLAEHLSQGGGIGLAKLIEQQLGGASAHFTPASVLRNDANLSSLSEKLRQQTNVPLNIPSAPSVLETVKPAFKTSLFDSAQTFIDEVRPHAERAASALGTDAESLIAQAALETGWGKHVIHQGDGTPTFNLFGIKANRQWQGDHAVVDTIEFDGAVASTQKAAFRAYSSLAEAVDDYVSFVKEHPRYQHALANVTNAQEYFTQLQSAGYATDPAYAEKIMSVYRRLMAERE